MYRHHPHRPLYIAENVVGGWVLVRSVQHAVDAQHSSARTTLNYEIHPIMTHTRRCVARLVPHAAVTGTGRLMVVAAHRNAALTVMTSLSSARQHNPRKGPAIVPSNRLV